MLALAPHAATWPRQATLGQLLDRQYGPSFPLALVDATLGAGVAYVGIRTGLTATGFLQTAGWITGAFGVYYAFSGLHRGIELLR